MATTTPSGPPRFIATGKAWEVESTVPSVARTYSVVGFCSTSKSSSAEDLGMITAVSNFGTNATFSRTPTTP